MLPHSSVLSLAFRRQAAGDAQAAAREAAACCCEATARARWAAACRAYAAADRRANYTRRIVESYGHHYTRAFGVWRRTEARIPFLSCICSTWFRAIGRLSQPAPEVVAALASPLALLAYAQRHAPREAAPAAR